MIHMKQNIGFCSYLVNSAISSAICRPILPAPGLIPSGSPGTSNLSADFETEIGTQILNSASFAQIFTQ